MRCMILLVGCLGLLAACSDADAPPSPTAPVPAVALSPAADTPSVGDRLVSTSSGDATNLIPMIAGDAARHEIAGQLYLPLLKYDAKLNLTGQLAASWKVAENNLSIRFQLRPGLKWSDGVPFTSADCLFTLNLIQDAKTQSPYKADYARVASAEAPDPYTFVVYYHQTYSPALASWAELAILPQHLFAGEDIMHTRLSRHPTVSIGPYQLAEWVSQQSIRLTRNPDYFDGPV